MHANIVMKFSAFLFCHDHAYSILYSQIKRFSKMLQKLNNNSCDLHSLPADSIEELRPIYSSGNFNEFLFLF